MSLGRISLILGIIYGLSIVVLFLLGTLDLVLISLISGLTSALCWLIGDIFLVGYEGKEEEYKDFLKDTLIKDKKMAVLMLSGSTKHLRFGALIANFSIPFMLMSIQSLYVLAKPSSWTIIAVICFIIAFSLSPVAHCAFYYVGSLCKSLLEQYNNNKTRNPPGELLVNEYLFFLNLTWVVAVGITFLAWLIYAMLIFFGETIFPPLFGLLTPLFMSPLAGVLTIKAKIGSPYLNGAGLNIGLGIFFIAALVYYVFFK